MTVLTVSGTEITDAARAAGAALGLSASGQMLDGRIGDSSFGIRRAATNLFRRGQCDAATDWNALGVGASAPVVDATVPGLFSPQSIKVVTDGTTANQGCQYTTATGLAAAPGTLGVAGLWFKGIAGRSYIFTSVWVNTDVTFTPGTGTVFTATGSYQWITASAVPVAAGKTGNAIEGWIQVNGTRAETFWLAHGMLEQGFSVVSPYVATSAGATATHAQSAPSIPFSGLGMNPTQGWVVGRVRIGWPSTITTVWDVQSPRIWSWHTDNSNFMPLCYSIPSGQWQFQRIAANAGNPALVTRAQNPGDIVTVIGRWMDTQVGISVAGSVFTNVANNNIPATPANMWIGTHAGGNGHLDGDVLWLAMGTGTLTDADAATINGFGDTDTPFSVLPSAAAPVMVWRANTAVADTFPANTVAPVAA